MNWMTDPTSKWVATYRLTMLSLLILLLLIVGSNTIVVRLLFQWVTGSPPPGIEVCT